MIQRLATTDTYAPDGTGTRELEVAVHIGNEAAVKSWGVVQLPFASSAEHVAVDYVRVREPGGAVIETPASSVQELPEPVTREAPFYSDLKDVQIPVRNLRVGDTLEYRLRVVRTKPEAPNHFWGTENLHIANVVVLDESLELHLPRGTYAQVWSPTLAPERRDTAREDVYFWHAAQLEPQAGVDEKTRQRREQIEAGDDPEGKLPQIAWTNFHSWEEVGAWYRGLEGSRTEPSADVRAKAAELIAGKSSDEEKARALYTYVSTQVRYIGVAFGVGRYQPHTSDEVLSNQYGDCKDKTTLLAALLTAANIPADSVLVGAGIRFNEAVPSPGSFNHAISLAHIGGKDVWLDSTAEVAPYRLLLPAVRGKQALVVPVSGAARVERIPKAPPFAETETFTADGTLSPEGTAKSHMVLVLHDDSEVIVRSALRSVGPGQYEQFLQQLSRSMGFGGTTSHPSFTSPEDLAEPLQMAYDYEREKAGDWDNLRITPQFPPVGVPTVDDTDPHLQSIDLGTPHTESAHTVLRLPAGWGAELPPAVHAKSAWITLDKTYKLDNGALVVDRKLVVLADRVPAGDWKAYQQWTKDAGLDGEPWVQLTRTASTHAVIDNPTAAGLVDQAVALEKQQQWDAARAKLDEVKSVNNKQAYLWSNYGYIAMRTGKANEARDDFEKEIAAHPDEERSYLLLATVEGMQHKPDDVLATLRKLLAHDPGSRDGAVMLSQTLFARGDYAGAEAPLRTVLAAHPDDTRLELLLANALAQEGKAAEATPVLRKLVGSSKDPGVLNDAAYLLANKELDVPTARQALAALEQRIANAGPDAAPRTLLQNASLLTATWDTLGWALYRQGDKAGAEPWLRAAWRNSLSAETGLHLGILLQGDGKAKEAAQIFALAEQGDSGENAADVKKQLGEHLAQLASAGSAAPSEASLQAARTYKVPRPSTVQGWATVQLAVSPSGVAEARVVDDNASLVPMLDRLKSVNLNLSIPSGSSVPLLRRGVLSCHSGPDCDLVLVSTRSALSDAGLR